MNFDTISFNFANMKHPDHLDVCWLKCYNSNYEKKIIYPDSGRKETEA